MMEKIMKVKLDPNEVVKIAVSIEINGENTYREAATRQNDSGLVNLFNELADMEKDHARFFSSMFREGHLNNEELIEVEDSDSAKKIADMISKGIFSQLPPDTSDMKALFKYALETEERTVEFYTSIKETFPSLIKESDIDFIIQEEENHIASIKDAMNEYFGL
jgi:rubrerythrin